MSSLSEEQKTKLIQAAIEGESTMCFGVPGVPLITHVAKNGSYSPYSKFRVGAALLASDGTIIKGANIENASYGGTICAERTAIVKAVSDGVRTFIGLAVTTDVPSAISPCGMCRQVLREFCPLQMPIFLVPAGHNPEDKANMETSVLLTDMETLLPHSFGPEQLLEPRLARL